MSKSAGVSASDAKTNRRDAALLAAFMMLFTFLLPTPVHSETANNGITTILFGNDRWKNYDFYSESARSTNVDWAVSLLFVNNATVDKVKSRLEDWSNLYEHPSSKSMDARMSNYYDQAWAWDGDKGKKNPICPAWTHSDHVRVYSNTTSGGYEHMYNSTLGYYVIATVHRDYNECGGSVGHGYSENAEDRLISQVNENTIVSPDHWNIYNREPLRHQGNHYWQGNGLASTVRIP